jgi:hypothetical protein
MSKQSRTYGATGRTIENPKWLGVRPTF